MNGDTQQQVLEDMLEAIKQLAAASFMLNLHTIHLAQADVSWIDAIFLSNYKVFEHKSGPFEHS